MKAGHIVKMFIGQLEEHFTAKKLTSKKFSNEKFGVNLPILIREKDLDEKMKVRYFAKGKFTLTVKKTEYLVCSQWYDRQKPRLCEAIIEATGMTTQKLAHIVNATLSDHDKTTVGKIKKLVGDNVDDAKKIMTLVASLEGKVSDVVDVMDVKVSGALPKAPVKEVKEKEVKEPAAKKESSKKESSKKESSKKEDKKEPAAKKESAAQKALNLAKAKKSGSNVSKKLQEAAKS